MTDEQSPLPRPEAARALLRCMLASARLLLRRRLRLPRRWVGTRLWFADGTSAWIYRETVVRGAVAESPCALVVRFRLRGVRGPTAHAVFRAESLLNTPLFVGFPGFVAKCGWPPTSTGCTAASTSGTAPAAPGPTPARCGGCSRW